MSTDVSSLVVAVDTTQVTTATKNLNEMAAAGKTVEAGVSGASNASKNASKGVDDLGKSIQRTRFEQQQLAYQMHDFGVQVFSGQSPLVALVQQGSQLTGTFGGVIPSFKAVAETFTATRIAAGGLVATIAYISYQFIKGAAESKNLQQALVSTGNYAGLTSQRFEDLSQSVAKSTNTTVASAKFTVMALASSGTVMSSNMDAAAQAAQRMALITGTSTEDIVKDFSKMKENVSAWAETANKQYHFVTAAQLENIKTLQEHGESGKAMAIVLEALNKHFDTNAVKLGYLARAWNSVTNAVSSFSNAIANLGSENAGADLKFLNEQIDRLAKGPKTPELANLMKLREEAQKRVDVENSRAKSAEESNKREEAQSKWNKLKEQSLTKQEQLAKKLSEASAAADKAGASAAEKQKVLAGIRQSSMGGAPTGLDVEVERMKKTQESEQKLFESRNNVIKQYHSAGLIDDNAYYDARKAARDEYLAAENAQFEQEKRLLESKARSSDPGRRIQGQKDLVDLEAKHNQILASVSATGAADYFERIAKAKAKIGKNIDSLEKENEALRKQGEEAGLTATQLEVLKQKRLEDALATKEQMLYSAERMNVDEAVLAQQEKEIELMREKVRLSKENAEKQKRIEEDSAAGAQKGIDIYVEEARKKGNATRDMVTRSLGSLEDNIAKMLTGGKVAWKDYFGSILQEAIKLQAVRPILAGIFKDFGPYMAGLFGGGGQRMPDFTGGGGGDSGLGTILSIGSSFFGGMFAEGGKPPVGKASIVGEKGPELFVPSSPGTIIPNNKIGGSNGMQINYSPIINIDSRTDQAQVQALVSRAVRAGNAKLVDDLRTAGKL